VAVVQVIRSGWDWEITRKSASHFLMKRRSGRWKRMVGVEAATPPPLPHLEQVNGAVLTMCIETLGEDQGARGRILEEVMAAEFEFRSVFHQNVLHTCEYISLSVAITEYHRLENL
jgi:hypothetical protein